MEKLTWTKQYGAHVAENAAHTHRYVIRRRNSEWQLEILRLMKHSPAGKKPLYFLAAGPSESQMSYTTKWRAVLHANIEEAEKNGTPEDVENLWDEMANRVMGIKTTTEEA